MAQSHEIETTPPIQRLPALRKVRSEKVKKLYKFMIDFMASRGVLSDDESNLMLTASFKQQGAQQLLERLDAEVYRDLWDAVRKEPSFAWFVVQLDVGLDVGRDGEDGVLPEKGGPSPFVTQKTEDEAEVGVRRLSHALSSRRCELQPFRTMTGAESQGFALITDETNASLKMKFQRLHKEIVAHDLSVVVAELFSEFVLSSDDMEKLVLIENSRAKSERLLAMLHQSPHPAAFVHLRLAMSNEPSLADVVSKIDALRVGDLDMSSRQCILVKEQQVSECRNTAEISFSRQIFPSTYHTVCKK